MGGGGGGGGIKGLSFTDTLGTSAKLATSFMCACIYYRNISRKKRPNAEF